MPKGTVQANIQHQWRLTLEALETGTEVSKEMNLTPSSDAERELWVKSTVQKRCPARAIYNALESSKPLET
jgi:hypothetical protein